MPVPTLLSLDARDRYPACLCLDWQAALRAPETLELSLILHFGSQWELLLSGRVKLSLRGGRLHLYGDRSPDGQPIFPTVCRLDSGAQLHWSPVATTEEPEAAWSGIFQLTSGEQALLGTSEVLPLGPWLDRESLAARVTVAAADLVLTSAEGLWLPTITPNQHAVLERRLARFLAQKRLAPDLSRMQRQATVQPAQAPKPDLEAEEQLQAHLQAAIAHPDADLLTLATLAGLEAATELAGGQLRGADLRGLDLSSVDLSRANLRGADLSDADLSEANLRGARLGGADLSGALLSRADLRDCDLHRASLALANLGGADLRGANLLAANLSNANWSHTQVAGAQFDRNTGLTAELQESFLAQGAQLLSV